MERRALVYIGQQDRLDRFLSELRCIDWNIYTTANVTEAKRLIRKHSPLVGLALFDDILSGSLLEFEDFLATTSHIGWIALLDSALIDHRVTRDLIANHFYDYHTLPPDTERLLHTLGHAWGKAEIARSNRSPTIGEVDDNDMIGTSPPMQDVLNTIHKLAGSEAPVTITGESGTGKELAALAIHKRSHRAQGPLVAVNCGAIPADLIQSELFGHEKGAFTGAVQNRVGRIQAADKGTILLDEIGDLSLDLQVNLLRFLQEGTIEKVGNAEPIPVDVRVIAATHRPLEKCVQEGRFREDLYYRLNVLRLELPPLRQREQDIELLAQHYLSKFSRRNRKINGFSRQALRAINTYAWPGNIRELVNRIHRAVVMCDKRFITVDDLGLEQYSGSRSIPTLKEARAEAEKHAITSCLRSTQNNISEAARMLAVSRLTLYRLIEKYELA